MAPRDLHWGRGAGVVVFLGIVMVGGYLVRPDADPGVAVGMALASAAVLAAVGILYWASHRTS